MPIGRRELTVLGEFKAFGLVAEALDGDQTEPEEEYNYFLFDPDVTKQRDEDHLIEFTPPSTDRSDYELFIRANRITWSIGSRVYKRFTLPSAVIKTCWCRMGDMKDALLSVLLNDSLTMYNTSGEIASVPLPRSIVSIWPLPFGLLLQQVPEGNSPLHSPFPLTIPFSNSRDASRSKRDIGYSPQHNYSAIHGYDYINKGKGASPSSHLILKDPLQEPEPIFTEERGRLNTMKEFDERTIWTSDHVPLMASFNKVKIQHSVWVAEVVSSSHEIFTEKLDDVVPAGVLPKQYLFRRIWQGKVSQTASSKVFLATDDDLAPVISFLLQDQRKLMCTRLQSIEINYEMTYDTNLDMSWSVPAISAAPVSVTRPRVKMGSLPSLDIIALTPEYDLILYSGKQCLCRYILPPFLNDQPLQRKKSTESSSKINDLKIVGLADAVEGRINVTLNNAMIYRCTVQRSPSSSVVSDCLSAMVDGLSSNFYTHFLVTFWGDGDLANPHPSVDTEWHSFCKTVLQGCRKANLASRKLSNKDMQPSWEFLINSIYHKNYQKNNYISGPSPGTSFGLQEPESFEPLRRSDKSFYTDFLSETLDCLHAVYESMKLDILRKRDLGLLVVLLCKISIYLGEGSYLDHYIRDFPDLLQEFGMLEQSRSPKAPPNLWRWLENCLRDGCSSANVHDLPILVCKGGSSVVNWARKIVSFYSLLCGAEQIERNLSTGVFCNITSGSSSNKEELTILAMVGEGFGLQQLDLLPAGASLPLRHALDKCRESPPLGWPAAAYVLLGREDLALSCFAHLGKSIAVEAHASMKLISMSSPYMLHLHPTTIHSSVSESIDAENSKTEDVDSAEGSVIDGMEHIFNYSTQLRFGRDLRLNEVRRLLSSAKPVVIQTPVNPTASDQDLQQAQLWQLAQRTTALPFGRGAFTLATTCTLLTEALAVPKLVLAGRLPAQQNAMVNLDPNLRNVQELKCWPEFHNAVAAGLRLAPVQGKASRTWILYNRPVEPDAVHAGLLLALGLHGHLKVLSITDVYQYYSLEHESTTVGLMLGLAASYRGTMQPAISKSLYVHIPARNPFSFPELELPTLLQSAAVMSVGLLYEGAAHPQTMQILLGEIGRRSGGDNVLEREGYAVSAGYALGLVALGRGNDALGFKDTLVARLFQYIGGKEFQNDLFNLPTSIMDEHNRNTGFTPVFHIFLLVNYFKPIT
ncbi:hypothetical protein Leryth_006968 [Lithospermum erythrorhizon]|nr:hypothetical protein Leryth_006968 [Lithospermum erythrorhizon]